LHCVTHFIPYSPHTTHHAPHTTHHARSPLPHRQLKKLLLTPAKNGLHLEVHVPQTEPGLFPNGQPHDLTLHLHSLEAQHVKYVCFPLCPRLKIKVLEQTYLTSKQLYTRER
jgi:hypothetical protein